MPFGIVFGAEIVTKCDFVFLLTFIDFPFDFSMLFVTWRVLFSFHFGTFFGSLFASMFYLFCVIFRSFWEPKAVILGIDFWMNFACRPKSGT